jgi:4-amino-4-deoxy-L-arabinose transferase-like glycosyltransferase
MIDGDGAIGELFAWLARGWRAYAVLTALCLVVFGAGLARLPPTDRDESRFMQASRQMIESGDYARIRVQQEPRAKKPIGIHWLQTAAVRLAGQPLNRAWPYRLPSALGAWAAVLLVCFAGRRLFGARAGLAAGLMLATLPLTVAEAHLAKTDAALLGAVTLAMVALGDVYRALADGRRGSARWAAAFWLAVGGAILLKGPVVVLVAGATVVTLCLSDRSAALLGALRPLWGIPLAALVLAPWLATLLEPGNGNFLAAALRQDILPKLAGGQESHGAPPGTYLVLSALTAWPWSLAVPLALIAAWPARGTPAVRFCFAWLVPAWLAFEAVPTKLPHYVLPLMPAAALLLGAAVEDGRRWHGVMTRAAGRGWRLIWAGASIALGAATVLLARRYGAPDVFAAVAGTVAALGGCVVALGAGRLGPSTACGALGLLAAGYGGLALDRVVPELQTLWVSQRLAAEIARHTHTGPPILVGFHEPSAVFLLGTDTRLTDAAGAAGLMLARVGTLAAVDAPDVDALRRPLEDAGWTVTPLGTVAGYNYARGTDVALTLLTAAPPP